VSEGKTCPLNGKICLGPGCALWVELQKNTPNPFYRYVFQGCGLVQHVPWTPEKRKEGEA